MKNFWEDSASSIRERKKDDDKVVIENSYGKVAFKENNQNLAVEMSRKNEYHEETFDNSREVLQEGHVNVIDTQSGQLTVDSHQKEKSAVVYEESITTPAEKIFKHLQELKYEVQNDTLNEMIPEKASVQKKIYQELKLAKEEIETKSLEVYTLGLFMEEKEHLSDDGIDEEEDKKGSKD